MTDKNEYKESFINWLKVKGGILVAVIILIAVIYLIRWLVVIPYISYLSIGHWGIIIGGILMFILINIPLGIIFTIFKFDEEDIMPIEIICAIISAITVGVTYMIIYLNQTL